MSGRTCMYMQWGLPARWEAPWLEYNNIIRGAARHYELHASHTLVKEFSVLAEVH